MVFKSMALIKLKSKGLISKYILILNIKRMLWNFRGLPHSFFFKVKKKVTPFPGLLFADICPL